MLRKAWKCSLKRNTVKSLLKIILCGCLPACLCTTWAWCLQRQEEGVRIIKTKDRGTNSCELPYKCWELLPGPLEEQSVPLTTIHFSSLRIGFSSPYYNNLQEWKKKQKKNPSTYWREKPFVYSGVHMHVHVYVWECICMCCTGTRTTHLQKPEKNFRSLRAGVMDVYKVPKIFADAGKLWPSWLHNKCS